MNILSHPSDERKYLTEDELKHLLQVVKTRGSTRDLAIFTVTYWRGLRASEVGRIPLSAWNQAKRRLYVTRLKGSLAGEFPLSKQEHSALTSWLAVRGTAPGPLFPSRESGMNGAGISRKRLDSLIRGYATAAGLPVHLRHMHCLKHALGTHLVGKGADLYAVKDSTIQPGEWVSVGKGADLYAVKDWLGHKAFSSTLVYAQFRSQQRDAAARKIYQQD